MSDSLKFKKIKPRMIFWFFTAVLLPMIIVCSIIYYQRVVAIKTEEFQKLTAIRDLKVTQLKNWLQERRSDLGVISRIPDIRNMVDLFMQGEISDVDQSTAKHIQTILESFVEEYSAYHEIFLINVRTGIVEISSDKSSQGLNASDAPFYLEPLRTGSYYIRDIYYSRNLKKPAMCFAMPLFSETDKGRKQTAILVSRVDLEHSLYTLLLERTGMGKTGETLIVNRDATALNELRWYDDAPLKLQISAKPAVLASQGNTGIIETLDYRDVEVLASYTYLPEAQWGFVAKQDLSEIYAPIRKMLFNMAVILLASGLVAYLLAHTLAMNFSNPVLEVTRAASKIQEGDLTVRCKIKKNDEYGILGRAFNNMAESMELYNATHTGLNRLNEIIVNSKTPDEFGKNYLQNLLELTKSDFGVFFLYDSVSDTFKHLSSIGFHKDAMTRLNGNLFNGAFDRACATKQIAYIYDLSKDTVFTVNTIAGKFLPKCLVTIPILNQGRILAVIAFGSMSTYSEVATRIITQVQSSVGTALSNILYNEKTASLARELQDKNVELKAQAVELQTVTDNLKQQNIELDLQSKQLEEASRMKSVFLSNMSHELRTPLNSIMALSSVLKMNASGKLDQEELEYLDVIERNGKRLLDLINDILDLSKIEAGHMEVVLSSFSPKTTIENVMDSLRPVALKKNLEIDMELPESLPEIQSDEKRVHQILVNLAGNAVKFTEKGRVSVKAGVNGDDIYMKVSDTGIGIAEKNLSSIFEEFRQVDSSTSRRHEGTGLGLAIAHKAARNLGGDITVDSRPGQGTTFTLILPLVWKGPALQQDAFHVSEVDAASGKKKTVLVVDDEPKIANLIADYLSKEGYTPLLAKTGQDALELAKTHNPFAITLDLIMPQMDGLEILQKLKHDPDTADIPVIIVSVSDDHRTGIALGAVGHLTKPVIREELIKELHKACANPTSIMVADDNHFERLSITQMLNQKDMITIEAENGRACLDKIKSAKPDALILDLLMPELDGFGVLRQLRSDPETMTLPVIIVTAKDLTPEEKQTLNQYAVSVVHKSNLTPEGLLTEMGNSLRHIEARHSQASCPQKSSAKRILIVEDNEAAILQIKMILEQEGYIVYPARGGREAREIVDRIIPDGIILDLMMPDVDGFKVLEKIRGKKETSEIPVLILTAKDLTPDDFKKLSANNIQQLIQKGDVEREGLLLKLKIMLEEKTQPVKKSAGNTVEKQNFMTVSGCLKKPEPETARLGLPKILVIEDNPDNMFTLRAVLKKKYAMMEADNGEKGIESAFQDPPDLILLDISLPDKDGFDVVKELKADDRSSHIPVIALTAHAMKGDREKVIDAGCNDYLSKPIDPGKIMATIDKWIEGTR